VRFSQRIGKKPIKTELQIDTMDDDLRRSLWNVFKILFLDEVKTYYNHIEDTEFEEFFKKIWIDFFKVSLDTLGNYFPDVYEYIRNWFFISKWYEVYDFIEFISQIDSHVKKESFINDKSFFS